MDARGPAIDAQLPAAGEHDPGARTGRALLFTGVVDAPLHRGNGTLPGAPGVAPGPSPNISKTARAGLPARQGGRFRQALIVAEVMLSVVLLVGAGAVARELPQADQHGAGVRAARRSRRVRQPAAGTVRDRGAADGVLRPHRSSGCARNRASPMPRSPFSTPLTGGGARPPYSIAGQPLLPLGQRPIVGPQHRQRRTTSACSASRSRRDGRSPPDDRCNAPRRGASSTSRWRSALFPVRSAVGQTLLLGPDATTRVEIVGVIRDVKSAGLNVPTPDEMYFPLAPDARVRA